MSDKRSTSLDALRQYSKARRDLLASLGIPASNRDPLAEFSEYFVSALLGGEFAPSRVEKGHDLIDDQGRRVQVRYLANPRDRWVNEHVVSFVDNLEEYALVLFENLDPVGVVVFPRMSMLRVGAALGKRHPNQDMTLQFTRRNWNTLRAGRAEFEAFGVQMITPPGWGSEVALRTS